MISFAEFATEVHLEIAREGSALYPWQLRVAERCAHGEPPNVIGLPTGAGKTMMVDILVWALACQADRPSAQRTVGTRIVWAIDRRILVDEVHAHAMWLAERLAHAHDDETDRLHEVAERLRALSGDGVPLVATRWRGGLEGRPERHHPLQPQVITSTVAQIGSRLLFRGFGVGKRSVALEAGLAACDTTICLDEAHLAGPFVETTAAIARMRSETERELPLPPLRAIVITATPESSSDDAELLQDDDRRALGLRWNGPKQAALSVPDGMRDGDRVAALVDATVEHLERGAMSIACVVNSVRRARDVFAALEKRVDGDGVDLQLLIGPQRPADRQRVLTPQRREQLFDGAPPQVPLVIVATQTFEVGLDADVAAMVTESASASALTQRLGRLNRRGRGQGDATIVRDEGSWLYGADEQAAWEWLRSRERSDGTIDVSVAALYDDPDRPTAGQSSYAPSLTDEIVERLVQTDPRPDRWADPDVEVFLRGVESKPTADAAICWRSDLRLDGAVEGDIHYSRMLMEVVPPQRREILSLDVASVRALLVARLARSPTAARAATADSDIEGEPVDIRADVPGHADEAARFLVVRGGRTNVGAFPQADDGEMKVGDLVPGDVVVLPCELGGADERGLAPQSDRASDVAADLDVEGASSDASRSTESVAPARITPEAISQLPEVDLSESLWRRIERVCKKAEVDLSVAPGVSERDRAMSKLMESLRSLLPVHPGLSAVASMRPADLSLRAIAVMAGGDGQQDDSDDEYDRDEELVDDALEGVDQAGDTAAERTRWWTIPERRPTCTWVIVPTAKGRRDWTYRPTGTDRPPPTLDAHAVAVCSQVDEFARGLQLSASIRESLKIAARAHDHGKADPRIQAYFRQGVPAHSELIAKSEFGRRDPRLDRMARDAAGLPSGLRHEIGSVAALLDATRTGSVASTGFDLVLTLHLIGVHHGEGRPVPPVPHEGGRRPSGFVAEAAGIVGRAVGDGVDGWDHGEWMERFWRVVERYGAWGTAYLEALLVSADRLVSANGG